MTIKKVWLTEIEPFTSLSLESADPLEEHTRLHFREALYPADPTPENPLRHVLVISCLTDEDLAMLYNGIGEYLGIRP